MLTQSDIQYKSQIVRGQPIYIYIYTHFNSWNYNSRYHRSVTGEKMYIHIITIEIITEGIHANELKDKVYVAQ